MDDTIIRKLSAKLRISPNQIAREYWEMLVLKDLAVVRWSTRLIFRGGTALRLAYGSPRYSDDLDFSLSANISTADIFGWATTFADRHRVRITDQWEKYYTVLIGLFIRDEFLSLPFRIKLEISKRRPFLKRNDWSPNLLSSPSTNFDVLFRVATLERIYKEKIAALRDRKEPRDLFDLWYVAQKLRRPVPNDLPKLNEKILRQNLNKYLPTDWRPVISELAKR
jgi:predicted nucleotidyltransferase component of viral defense system